MVKIKPTIFRLKAKYSGLHFCIELKFPYRNALKRGSFRFVIFVISDIINSFCKRFIFIQAVLFFKRGVEHFARVGFERIAELLVVHRKNLGCAARNILLDARGFGGYFAEVDDAGEFAIAVLCTIVVDDKLSVD